MARLMPQMQSETDNRIDLRMKELPPPVTEVLCM